MSEILQGVELVQPKEEEKVKVDQNKRIPYAVWTVGHEEYKLKLTAAEISKLEAAYKKNLLLVVIEEDVPPISTMLTIIQAAMQKYHHGIKYQTVQELYDVYVDDGGDQVTLLTSVMMPLLAASGFFTQEQALEMTKAMENLD